MNAARETREFVRNGKITKMLHFSPRARNLTMKTAQHSLSSECDEKMKYIKWKFYERLKTSKILTNLFLTL